MTTCRSCGAEVVWIKTAKGKMMICEKKVRTVVTPQGETVTGHEPHWGSCPDAEKFRKP